MIVPGSAQDPLWFKDALIYELHVRTFFDSNNDGIGDFPGLTQKLDYLHDLGVTCLWLLPFFPSPLRDDGYDIADYHGVHPHYGTLEDFQAFLRAAHERNLQVMIELVINHTSDQHPWFQAARRAPADSPERDYYVWSDTDQKYREARIIFTDTEKSNWTWDPVAKAYYWHRFFSHQPDLNFDNPAVLEEVQNVMRFWLDMGVDALRLDAIPYLVEREGTNCENLPETHALVKRIRRAMDERYACRMILAEANQWPTDVRDYFGEGDECHMAFHFPLMPRLFMALRLEDRHPIDDILAQTPPVPDCCQWGLFLRNHDELTLEMVTDEERDYMYLAYSADPKMRVNFGIRRRLAPLMENNRRRIELLNSLLFSFPGTPILYYGDEIGMGDNIYLGDRNGVRTPMQWSADRNAGFSRANPAKLYSPVIMDPVYGFEAVNVESQQSDSSSLLNWMRRMTALRKLFKVFGRGTMELLRPANRKVLAYLRCYEDEQILCVANLSRFAQPVELDLSSFAGMTPVEMVGYVEFPKIGDAPYALTLNGYGFLWFELLGTPEPIEIAPAAEAADTNLVLASDRWNDLFDNGARDALEHRILPAFLPKQRWFGSKSRSIQSVHIQDWSLLEGARAALVLLEVRYAEHDPESYFVPVALMQGEAAAKLSESNPAAILCPAMIGSESGLLCDAMADDEACRAILEAMRSNVPIPCADGILQPEPGPALLESSVPAGSLPIRHGTAEQSNSSILFGDLFILKLFRRPQSGPNPDCEIGRYLTERVGFSRIPKFGGEIKYRLPNSSPMTLAMLQALVENWGDGWETTLTELGRYYEQCCPGDRNLDTPVCAPSAFFDLAKTELDQKACETIGIYYDAAVALGRRTAEMHLALSSPTDDPAFAPEPFTAGDRARLARVLREDATSVFNLLKENLARLPDELIEQAGSLLSQRGKVWARLGELETLPLDCLKIRIHGDFHLGQVLRVANDFMVLDFEGEPARSLEERRAKQLVLKDVAGMLRSFSYAAHAALLTHAARIPAEYSRLEPWAKSWECTVSAVFLRSYRLTAAGAAFLPAEPDHFRRLLEIYLLDKALYELSYEINNRPAWVCIPLWGILSLGFDTGPQQIVAR
ncbi:MAG: maltose alpha-D-glucosyltransferase [Acidobacteria bacterium]|nr:maltose alpha-D-glucosyltransferase [Acidobacteriota bacterium]